MLDIWHIIMNHTNTSPSRHKKTPISLRFWSFLYLVNARLKTDWNLPKIKAVMQQSDAIFFN